MTEPTPAPGARLKIERERRGLSLQKAADEMRLDAWVVEALETDQYERVGPAVYAKGHLKRYASVLGVSWEEIVSGYEALRSAPESPPQVAPSMRLRAPAAAVNHLPRGQIAGMALLLLGVGYLFWLRPWQQQKLPSQIVVAPAPARTVAPAAADPDPGTAAALRQPTVAVAEPPAAARPAADDGLGPAHGPVRLRLSFSAESWVDIYDADGKRLYSGYGRANSVKSLAGDGPLKVYLGYASGVQVEINERAVAIAAPFMHGDVARFLAGADGVLRGFAADSHPAG